MDTKLARGLMRGRNLSKIIQWHGSRFGTRSCLLVAAGLGRCWEHSWEFLVEVPLLGLPPHPCPSAHFLFLRRPLQLFQHSSYLLLANYLSFQIHWRTVSCSRMIFEKLAQALRTEKVSQGRTAGWEESLSEGTVGNGPSWERRAHIWLPKHPTLLRKQDSGDELRLNQVLFDLTV